MNLNTIISIAMGKQGFKQYAACRVEAFSIESAMDTDADVFSIDVRPPTLLNVREFLVRDNEVRANIFTDKAEQLHSGISDMVVYENGMLSIAGRDISCVATDSQAPPGMKKKVRPHVLVANEAKLLGISRLKLTPVKAISKFYRTGSESYWESWYRLYSHRKMWLWVDSTGRLIADKLNYSGSPSYYFGWPKVGKTDKRWIPIETLKITKSAQGRLGEVWVFGTRSGGGTGSSNLIGFRGRAIDRTINSWTKQPLKIITSTKSKNKTEAVKEAWEEIFEGKVGAFEIEITIPHSILGTLIKQNRMAMVNFPEIGIVGMYFVVGTKLEGGTDGYTQTIRLREKQFAITKRVPDDPEIVKDPGDTITPSDAGGALSSSGIRWGDAFASAAQEFHGGWDYTLFLGVLLAICNCEGNFKNVREGGDTEWYKKPSDTVLKKGPYGDYPVPSSEKINEWKSLFANKAGNKLNPFSREAGVGPMQLTTASYKEQADKYGKSHDEYSGGRWMPSCNIRAGAKAFAGKLTGLDPQVDANIWIGVERYNGSGPRAQAYRKKVFTVWKSKYAAVTKDVTKTGKLTMSSEYNVADESGNMVTVQVPKKAPNYVKKAIHYGLRQLGKPYEWGARGPSSFDCSGLAHAMYADAGFPVSLGNTYTDWNNSNFKHITKDQLLIGDLVFFNNQSHMGIYLGNGHFLQAPHAGDVVKISALNSGYYREHYDGARRVVQWKDSSAGD